MLGCKARVALKQCSCSLRRVRRWPARRCFAPRRGRIPFGLPRRRLGGCCDALGTAGGAARVDRGGVIGCAVPLAQKVRLPVVALKLCCRSNCILCVSRRSILGPRRSLHQGLLLVDALLDDRQRLTYLEVVDVRLIVETRGKVDEISRLLLLQLLRLLLCQCPLWLHHIRRCNSSRRCRRSPLLPHRRCGRLPAGHRLDALMSRSAPCLMRLRRLIEGAVG
mmetsp:Transcript_22956/g.67614  ORF Transcript_22956/g.67614 Transcript_22956/m.67614 type:complete len:222 (-) Transcript_22956:484-1149(-)